MNAPTFTRRDISKGLGAILVAFSLDPKGALAAGQPARLPGSLQTNRMLDAWLRINADGTATVFTGKVELGQGIVTALAQIAAEELDLPLARVRMISGDTGRTPNEGQTAGSQSVENSGTALRLAAAEARAMLIEQAAKRLGAGAETLKVADGVISAPDGRKVAYGEIAGDVDLRREASAKVGAEAGRQPQDRRQVDPAFRHSGQSHRRRRFRAGHPAARTCCMAAWCVRRATGRSSTASTRPRRSRCPGVVAVVREGSFLGVIAQREEQAIKARKVLGRVRRLDGRARPAGRRRASTTHLKSLPSKDTVIGVKETPVLAAAAPAAGGDLHETLSGPCLDRPFLRAGRVQGRQDDGVDAFARACSRCAASSRGHCKMQPAAVRCIHAEGSGCYGHNGADDVALDAALLARAVPGKPVRLQWMRDDEFAWEPYGAAMVMQAKAALGADGRIADWQYELWSNAAFDPARFAATAPMCWRPGIWPSRCRWRRRAIRRSRRAAATATRFRSTTFPTSAW